MGKIYRLLHRFRILLRSLDDTVSSERLLEERMRFNDDPWQTSRQKNIWRIHCRQANHVEMRRTAPFKERGLSSRSFET